MSNEDKEYIAFGIISLTKQEAREYAQIINDYPMEHEDCMSILRVAAEINLKTRLSGERIAEELKKIYSRILEQ